MKRGLYYLLAEPFIVIFYCFFQPTRFRKDLEIKSSLRLKRSAMMLRLTLPMLLISYPLVLMVLMSLNTMFPEIFALPSMFNFLLASAGNTFLGVVGGIALGITGGIGLGITGGIGFGIAGGIALGIAFGFEGGIVFGVIGGMIAGITGGIEEGIVVCFIVGVVGGIVGYVLGGIEGSIVIGILFGIAGGIEGGIEGGGSIENNESIGLGITTGLVIDIAFSIQFGIIRGIAIGIVFIISYILGYCRLPLYLVSAASGLWAYITSQNNPQQVFTYLHRSALYWDECVFLLLLGLKKILLIAAHQDSERTLKEIAFIVSKRPHQILAAQVASLEIALYDLEMRNTLRDIAQSTQRLTDIFPQEAGLIAPRWVTLFARINDASRDAARFCSPLGRHARSIALKDMISNLKKIHINTAFEDSRLNKRLGGVINTWLIAAENELQELKKMPQEMGQIDNPYIPGPALKLHDSLFVGRSDLAKMLDENLSRISQRPTFLLCGERRMGKSSTLNQLPNLLGARFIPIIYDLQVRGLSSSAASFLGAIAEEIYKATSARGMQIKKLQYQYLYEASQKNEATVYRLFDGWLKSLEYKLESMDRTLLLAFDEYEKLNEADMYQLLNLRLLLDWFRSVVQNRSRFILLFSGVRTIGEMGTRTGISWASYFVNVQILRVSFLRWEEAYQLITRPAHDFPSEQVFGAGVVDEIIRVTGCHPFLLQAICSAIIDNLNADKREHAEIRDVNIAVDQILENWWDTYFRDLWERTSQNQRACLVALNRQHECDVQEIIMQSLKLRLLNRYDNNLDERLVRYNLQKLLERNLVLFENNAYRISAPIFSEWVKRSSIFDPLEEE